MITEIVSAQRKELDQEIAGLAVEADLFAVHEDGFEIFFALLFGGALGGCYTAAHQDL